MSEEEDSQRSWTEEYARRNTFIEGDVRISFYHTNAKNISVLGEQVEFRPVGDLPNDNENDGKTSLK